MCCLFGCNCCPNQNVRIIRGATGPAGPRGPIGPQGATGPQGPVGASGTADIIYANSGAQTVATGAVIPLNFSAATPTTTMSVSGNAVNLPSAGTYLINYFVNGSVPTDDLSTSLYFNGAPLANETIVQTNTANSSSAASKTALITVPSAGTLSLYNTSTDTATISNASISALRSV